LRVITECFGRTTSHG